MCIRDRDCFDTTVDINPSGYTRKGEVPESLKIRFIKVMLDSGEIEILATSLLENKKYPTSDFREIYRLRWEIETYFQTLKSRLCIDNFTGKRVEAVYQDFYSTIFISGWETILTYDANLELENRETKNKLKVNKAVSFHTIKNKVIMLMNDPPEDIQEKMLALFLKNPTSIRPERKNPPRNKKDERTCKSLNFQRYAKKHVF